MRQLLQTAHNRWLVIFSSVVMFSCAALAGVSQQMLEKLTPEFKTSLVPGTPFGAGTLGVFAMLFLMGMMGNAGLILNPMERRRGFWSFVVMAIALAALVIAAFIFGARAFKVLCMCGSTVSGGE